jgi:hypothetical protein
MIPLKLGVIQNINGLRTLTTVIVISIHMLARKHPPSFTHAPPPIPHYEGLISVI